MRCKRAFEIHGFFISHTHSPVRVTREHCEMREREEMQAGGSLILHAQSLRLFGPYLCQERERVRGLTLLLFHTPSPRMMEYREYQTFQNIDGISRISEYRSLAAKWKRASPTDSGFISYLFLFYFYYGLSALIRTWSS